MKKLNLVLVTIIGFLVISCSSDDNDEENENPAITSGFVINGVEYATPYGFVFPTFSEGTYRYHKVYLLDQVIINNELFGFGCGFSNDLTQGFVFDVRSSSINELATGTYNFELNTSEPSVQESAFNTNIEVQMNCVVNSDFINETQFSSGSLTIEKSEDIYTLNYAFQTNNFGTIEGTYVGELQLVQEVSNN